MSLNARWTRRANIWRPRVEDGYLSSSTDNKFSLSPFFFFCFVLFYWNPQWIRGCPLALEMVMRLPIQMSVSSGNTDTYSQKYCFYQLSGHPWAQPNRQIKLAIIHLAPLHVHCPQSDHSLVGMSYDGGCEFWGKGRDGNVQWGAVGSQSFHIQLTPNYSFVLISHCPKS